MKKLIIVTGYLIRFVNNLKGTLKNDNANVLLENTLTIDEYNNALNLWIKTEQGILQRQTDFGKSKVFIEVICGHIRIATFERSIQECTA